MLQTIRRLLIRPGRFRLERELPGGICTHDICAPWQGTQWNRIEHRLFAFITMNWRGKPLVSHQVIVRTDRLPPRPMTGLRSAARLDGKLYPKGIKVPDKEMGNLNITRDEFHGEWNYTISPRVPP